MRRLHDLSLEIGRRILVLSRTGRLAADLARQPEGDKLITVIPANAQERIVEAVQATLSTTEKNSAIELNMPEKLVGKTQFSSR